LADLSEGGELVAGRERVTEHGIGGFWRGHDRTAAPDERPRCADGVNRVLDSDGTTEQRNDRIASAADRRQQSAALVHSSFPHDLGPARMPLEEVGKQRGIPAQDYSAGVPRLAEQ